MRESLGAAFERRPVLRRIAGYSAGSVVATVCSELAFLVVLGWLHGGTTWASAAGFVGGAVPNYVLNRRWAWSERRGRDRRAEVLLYLTVAVASFVASAVATHWAEEGARNLTGSHGWTVALTGLAYLGVSAVFFVAKFVLYERVVFIPARSASAEPRISEPTR
ncbi:MAG TPA: GtrA family protein [Acidimicrobiales bacterium]|nr:GtrA family protein [Acidimicrobiales bacterium]